VTRNVAEAVDPPRVPKKEVTPLSMSRHAPSSKRRAGTVLKFSTCSPSTPG
jgi:hypothetical protein